MSSRPSCPGRSSSAAPTAAGASRMPEVRHSTWLAGLAIPNFTLAHPKNAEVLCASTLAAVLLPRPDHTSYKDSYVEKLSRRLFSGAFLRFQGCSGLVLVGAGLVICIRGRASSGPCQGLAPRADSRSSAIRWRASRFRTSRSGLSSLAIDKRVRRLQAVAVAQSALGRRGRKSSRGAVDLATFVRPTPPGSKSSNGARPSLGRGERLYAIAFWLFHAEIGASSSRPRSDSLGAPHGSHGIVPDRGPTAAYHRRMALQQEL